TLPCGTNTADTVLSFTLTQRELVYADTFGSAINTILYFSDLACGNATPPPQGAGYVACNDDACGGQQSQVVAMLGAGKHYLVVSGAGATGTVTVHFQRITVGNGSVETLAAGMNTLMGTTSGTGVRNNCEAAGPDNSYWWMTCPSYAGGAFSASTCNNAT